MIKMHLVKRLGNKERFDERKVYASCYAACLSCRINKKEAEKICEKVAKEVKRWVKSKKEVTSTQIFKKTASVIRKHNKDAAFMYHTHRDIS